MLGGSCSPCCGCTQEKADALNAQLRTMSVECQITQQSYVPQTGFVFASTAAVAAFGWRLQPDTSPLTLDQLRSQISDSTFDPYCFVADEEQQVSSSPYSLFLDASATGVPLYRYEDEHIEITLYCGYYATPGIGVSVGSSGCGVAWNLRVRKKRRQANDSLRNVLQLQVSEATYGPELRTDSPTNPVWGDTNAAAVAKYLAWDYETYISQPLDAIPPATSRMFTPTGWKIGDFEYAYTQETKPLIYANAWGDFGTGSVVQSQDGAGLTLSLDSRTLNNTSLALHDRTSEDYQLEPPLVQSPSYSLTRTGVASIQFRQESAGVSRKTVSNVGTPFTVSAVVEMTPA